MMRLHLNATKGIGVAESLRFSINQLWNHIGVAPCKWLFALSGIFRVFLLRKKKNQPDFAVRRRALHDGGQGFSKFRFVVLNASKKIKMQVFSMPFRCDLIQEGWRNIMQM